MDSKNETPLSEVSNNLIPAAAPVMELIMFFNILCIYLFVSSSKILVTMDHFRYLCIVLYQSHHLI